MLPLSETLFHLALNHSRAPLQQPPPSQAPQSLSPFFFFFLSFFLPLIPKNRVSQEVGRGGGGGEKEIQSFSFFFLCQDVFPEQAPRDGLDEADDERLQGGDGERWDAGVLRGIPGAY